jgi:hypothetical protein
MIMARWGLGGTSNSRKTAFVPVSPAPSRPEARWWHVSCSNCEKQGGALGAPRAWRPVNECDADCLTSTPSQPLPLTLDRNRPAAARIPPVQRHPLPNGLSLVLAGAP